MASSWASKASADLGVASAGSTIASTASVGSPGRPSRLRPRVWRSPLALSRPHRSSPHRAQPGRVTGLFLQWTSAGEGTASSACGEDARLLGRPRGRRCGIAVIEGRDPSFDQIDAALKAVEGSIAATFPQAPSMALTWESIRSQIRRRRRSPASAMRFPGSPGRPCATGARFSSKARSPSAADAAAFASSSAALIPISASASPELGAGTFCAASVSQSGTPHRAPSWCPHCGYVWHTRRETSGPARSP